MSADLIAALGQAQCRPSPGTERSVSRARSAGTSSISRDSCRQLDSIGQRSGSKSLYKPATCKRGVHSLAEVGYTATVRDGRLVVRCLVCADIPAPDHSWTLTTTEPPPDSAELNDRPYVGIDPHFVAQPVRRT